LVGLDLGWIGWDALAVGALLTFAFAALVAASILLSARTTRRFGLPLAPFMAMGAIGAIVVAR
jgi:leader peptidase (prepilin peptidase)/N-methyltransferase